MLAVWSDWLSTDLARAPFLPVLVRRCPFVPARPWLAMSSEQLSWPDLSGLRLVLPLSFTAPLLHSTLCPPRRQPDLSATTRSYSSGVLFSLCFYFCLWLSFSLLWLSGAVRRPPPRRPPVPARLSQCDTAQLTHSLTNSPHSLTRSPCVLLRRLAAASAPE